MFSSLKQSTTFIQLLTKTNILVSSVKNVHFLQTSTALDSDGASNLLDCKWIKLMSPSPLHSRVVFIGLISLHKSYSASWLHQFDAAGWMKDTRSWQRQAPSWCALSPLMLSSRVSGGFFCLLSLNIYYWPGFACRISCHSLAKTRFLNQGWVIISRWPCGKEILRF